MQTVAGNFQLFLALLLMEVSIQNPQQLAQASRTPTPVDKAAAGSGSTTVLSNSSATWDLDIPTDSSLTISIANCAGRTVFTGSYPAVAGGNQPFCWDGKGNDGTQCPDGEYRLTAIDSSGNPVSVCGPKS